jgi:hypothetical protein
MRQPCRLRAKPQQRTPGRDHLADGLQLRRRAGAFDQRQTILHQQYLHVIGGERLLQPGWIAPVMRGAVETVSDKRNDAAGWA